MLSQRNNKLRFVLFFIKLLNYYLFIETNFECDIDTQKSITCIIYKLNSSIVVWSSKLQTIITLHTIEDKY